MALHRIPWCNLICNVGCLKLPLGLVSGFYLLEADFDILRNQTFCNKSTSIKCIICGLKKSLGPIILGNRKYKKFPSAVCLRKGNKKITTSLNIFTVCGLVCVLTVNRCFDNRNKYTKSMNELCLVTSVLGAVSFCYIYTTHPIRW